MNEEIHTIHVAVGVLRDGKGRLLLARRHLESHQGGLWEFPGGKVETGETAEEALRRELLEELGIRVSTSRPLIRISHDYGERRVVLDTWLVTEWQGEPRGREGQPLKWMELRAIDPETMPAADLPLLKALNLPSLYVITPPTLEDEGLFLSQLESTLELGAKLIQYRVFNLEPAPWRKLARKADAVCRERGARLLLNAVPETAVALGVQGLHLNTRQLMTLDSLEGLQGILVGASCHDERELKKAQALGVDFAVLSPVLPTASHPEAEPLGWEGFSRMVEELSIPVYSLGGMQPELLERAWREGAQGIAGITGLWNPGKN